MDSAKTITAEDIVQRTLARVLPVILQEMGVLPRKKDGDARDCSVPDKGKDGPQKGVGPERGGGASALAAEPSCRGAAPLPPPLHL